VRYSALWNGLLSRQFHKNARGEAAPLAFSPLEGCPEVEAAVRWAAGKNESRPVFLHVMAICFHSQCCDANNLRAVLNSAAQTLSLRSASVGSGSLVSLDSAQAALLSALANAHVDSERTNWAACVSASYRDTKPTHSSWPRG
jgi:hypothetical protein